MSEEPEDGLEPISEGGLDENTDPDMNARDPLRQSQEIFHSLGHEDQIAATGEMDSVSIGSVNPMWQETPLGGNEQDAELPFLPAPDSDAAYSFDFDEAQLRETYPSLDMEPIPEDTQLAILTPSTEPETPIFEDTDEEKASLQEIDLSLDQDIEEALASFDLQGMEPLEEEELVCIFPEGMVSRDGNLGPFRQGIEDIVARTPAPVVPMALKGMWGSFFSYKDGAPMTRPFRRIRSQVELEIGQMIPVEQVSAHELAERIASMGGWDVPEESEDHSSSEEE